MKKWIACFLTVCLLAGSSAQASSPVDNIARWLEQQAINGGFTQEEDIPPSAPVVPPVTQPSAPPADNPPVTPPAQPDVPADDVVPPAEEIPPEINYDDLPDSEKPFDTGTGRDAYVIKDNGYRHYGTLTHLFSWNRMIILATADVLTTRYSVEDVKYFNNFSIDPQIFDSDTDWHVNVSSTDRSGEGEEGKTYVWVGDENDWPVAPTLPDVPEEDIVESEVHAAVDANGLVTLTAYTDKEVYSFGVYIEDVLYGMEGNTWQADKFTEYRFALLDELGNVLAVSAAVTFEPEDVPEVPEEPPIFEHELQVTLDEATGLVTLNAYTDKEVYSFGVYIEDVLYGMEGNTWQADKFTEYRFALLDELGNVLAVSSPIVWEPVENNPPVIEYALQISTQDYLSDGSPCTPTFTVTCEPELPEGMAVAVILNGEALGALEGSTFAPTLSGEYLFALIDANGSGVAQSDVYPVTIAEPEEEPVVYPEYELQVSAENYTEGTLCMPTFTVTTIPDMTDGMYLCVSTDAGLSILESNAYSPAESGEYRFMLFAPGEEGDIELARSASFSVLYGKPAANEIFSFTQQLDPDGNPLTDELNDEEISLDYQKTGENISADGKDVVTTFNSLFSTLTLTSSTNVVQEPSEIQLKVDSGSSPYFVLDGLPGEGGYTYAVKMEGTDYVALMSNEFVAYDSGDYHFAILDSGGNVVDSQFFGGVTGAGVPVIGTTDIDDDDLNLSITSSLAEDYKQGVWTAELPVFTLSGLMEDSGFSYAVRINDGDPVPFDGSSYTFEPEKDGKYTLSFTAINEAGVTASEQKEYSIWLDRTAPSLSIINQGSFTMQITAGDTLSSKLTVTLDTVGDRELTLTEGVGQIVYSASQSISFPPGKIVVKDEAGNTTANNATVTLYTLANVMTGNGMASLEGMSSTGGFSFSFGGGRGGSSTYRTVSHAKSSTTSVVSYDAVELVVENDSMSQLVVGSEAFDLELERDAFLVTDEYDENEPPTFSASFTALKADDDVDTLVLSANDSSDVIDRHSYSWTFSGTVYKKLAASGIDYLMLRIGDDVTVLSTAGFSAGIRYSMYRAEGLASKEFLYTVRMGAPDENFAMNVTVAGDTYQMTSDTSSEFYYYDVFNGTIDQLQKAEV